MIKTVSLTAGTETKVEISGGYNVGVINRTTGMLYASRKSGIVAGADDVAAIPAGDSYVIRAADDTVYLLATAAGDVQLESIGAKEVFKIAAARSSSGGGEGGTVDEVARQAISSHANNDEIHLTAEDAVKAAATTISNPNLLINPDLRINQRGLTEYTTVGTDGRALYTVDHWFIRGFSTVQLGDTNTVTFVPGSDSSNHAVFFDQTIENGSDYIGRELTFSAELAGGTVLVAKGVVPEPASDGTTLIFATATDAEKGATIRVSISNTALMVQVYVTDVNGVSFKRKFKLEIGSVVTPFVPPDPATELAKCQRYYQMRTTGDIDPVDLRPSMRTITDIRQREGGNYEYIAEL